MSPLRKVEIDRFITNYYEFLLL